MRAFYLFCLCCLCIFPTHASDTQPPALLLANVYQQGIELREYWVSEKLDGIRAYWNGEHLLSRQGNIIHAPAWFTAPLAADIKLDGELWIARGQFETVSAIVRSQSASEQQWRRISYQLFDMPDKEKTFDQRLHILADLVTRIHAEHIQLIRQFKIRSHQALMDTLGEYTDQGAEGLMLHRGSARYRSGRNNDLLKLKSYMDAEARVIRHYPGKGKFSGLMGSILVEDEQGLQFRIGSGFSNQQRQSPPAPGTIITYKYFGKTGKGIPRFASFLRIRNEK